MPLERVMVIGTTGSGKTTFATRLAGMLKVPHIELDAIHWQPGWKPLPENEFRRRVSQATSAPAWVCDGGYHAVRDLTWGRADTVIWLDFSFPFIFWRLLRRTVRRSWTREELWAGNRESWRQSFFSRDSILLWLLRSYRRRRRQYPQLLWLPDFAHLKVFRFQRPADAEAWLESLKERMEVMS